MRKCEKCGKEVLETVNECPYCGYVVKEVIEDVGTEKEVSVKSDHLEVPDDEKKIGAEPQYYDVSVDKEVVKEKKWFKRKSFIIPTVIAVLFFCLWIGDDSSTQLKTTKSELSSLQAELSELRTEYDEYKEEMEPFEEYSLEDIKQAKATREKEEKEEQKKLEEEKKKGYNTGITYEQLARTPDKYIGKKVKFSGKVIQVIEDDDEIQIRLAVNDDYDTILFASYDPSIVDSRILEDDHITIYGVSVGTISYESTMGGKITIPGVVIEKIDQ